MVVGNDGALLRQWRVLSPVAVALAVGTLLCPLQLCSAFRTCSLSDSVAVMGSRRSPVLCFRSAVTAAGGSSSFRSPWTSIGRGGPGGGGGGMTWKRRSSAASLSPSSTKLRMGLDPVTYLRTEYVSAALFTNQTPQSASVCLQLGTYDGRALAFVRRTIKEFITSSLEPDGECKIGLQRQLKESAERRGGEFLESVKLTYANQRADDLTEVDDETVDVVLSMQSAARMVEAGMDWKRSVREAARVLKPGGRLLFVEQSTVGGEGEGGNEEGGESYLEYVQNIKSLPGASGGEDDDDDDDDEERENVFEEVGFDEVDLVIKPHVAGVAIKALNAGMTKEERLAAERAREEERYAELSLSAFERGRKKKRRKKSATANKEDTKAEAAK